MSETPRDYRAMSGFPRSYIEAHEECCWESWQGQFSDIDRVPNTATITGYFDGFVRYDFDPPIRCEAGEDLSLKFSKRVKDLRQARP